MRAFALSLVVACSCASPEVPAFVYTSQPSHGYVAPPRAPERVRVSSRVVQIIDENNALVVLRPSDPSSELIWLTGFPTDGMADGQSLSGVYRDDLSFVGVKRYGSVADAARTFS